MDIIAEFDNIKKNFRKNLDSVIQLLEFDQAVLRFCLKHLNDLEEKLTGQGLENPYLSVKNTIKGIENIKKHESTKIKYRTISNQCLVLSVSHFASAIHDLFKKSINYSYKNNLSKRLSNEEFKFTIKELIELGPNFEEKIGELISENNSISFQDMKSIARAFNDYFGHEIQKTPTVENIIIGQACRHSIVHSGSTVDKKLINQIKSAKNNTVGIELVVDEQIDFSEDYLKIIMNGMAEYLTDLSDGLLIKWKIKKPERVPHSINY